MTYKLFFEFPNNSHLPSRLERFSEQELKFSPRFVLNERVAGEKKIFFLKSYDPTHSPTKTAEVVSVLEAEKSADKVQKPSKKRLLLFTPVKENMQS